MQTLSPDHYANTYISRAPRDWLQRRYRLSDATERLIAELTFPAGVERAAETARGAR